VSGLTTDANTAHFAAALVPSTDQLVGVLENLGIGRALLGCLLLGSSPSLVFHLAAIESHGPIVAEPG
jgi:hypothetical protein